MARNSWLHETARTYRDIRILQHAFGTDKNPKNGKGCSIALGAAIGISIVLLIWFILSVKSASQVEPTPTSTAVPTEEEQTEVKNSVNVQPSVAPTLTPIPTPTINPKLLIRYEEEGQCLIKGNINSKGEKIYHIPGSSSYASTKIDTKAGERWFCTEYDALRAGWHSPGQ